MPSIIEGYQTGYTALPGVSLSEAELSRAALDLTCDLLRKSGLISTVAFAKLQARMRLPSSPGSAEFPHDTLVRVPACFIGEVGVLSACILAEADANDMESIGSPFEGCPKFLFNYFLKVTASNAEWIAAQLGMESPLHTDSNTLRSCPQNPLSSRDHAEIEAEG